MAQELNSISKKVAIIGAGPAGCMCAYFLQDKFQVTLFDYKKPLSTLLATGGGRCNLAHAEYDFKELAKNYPRGEKFLYSVFSKFSTYDTIDFFEKIGVKTYTQDDSRIFPISNSAKDVREKFLKALNKVTFKKELVKQLDFKNFDYIVVATGGHSSYSLIKNHTIIPPKPSLIGLKTNENFPTGVTIKNVSSSKFNDDLLFTHDGLSGPLIFKISSINARKNYPYNIKLNFIPNINLQESLNTNSHKDLKNIMSEILPKSFVLFILNKLKINPDIKCYELNNKLKNDIINLLENFEVEITQVAKGSEVVTCGGISLDEVDSRTMESKITPNLYFCGEVLDIDGFCGGFNLQNCWSTGYIVAQSILNK